MIQEDKLKEAAEEAGKVLLDSLPDGDILHHTFSKQFKKKMRKLLWKEKYPIIYYGVKSVACVLGAVILSGVLLLTCSEDARAAMRGWIKELRGEVYYQYGFRGQANFKINTIRYEMSWIPEEYKFYLRQSLPNRETVIYEDSEGYLAEFTYMSAMDENMSSIGIGANSSSYEYMEVEIGGYKADCYISIDDEHTSTAVWSNEKNILFVVSARMEKEEFIKWAESVVEIKEK